MDVEMGEDGLNVTAISRDQCALLASALKSASDQRFMDDAECRKLFKLLAVLQSEVYDDMTAGRYDFSKHRPQ
ncbi:MAG: hypothetical protein ACK4IT_05925 [Thioalkalivibrionaceae bacterium]